MGNICVSGAVWKCMFVSEVVQERECGGGSEGEGVIV